MNQLAINTREMTKLFGRSFCALNNVSVSIQKGDIYGLVGRNGAGKTTLLRIIAGLAGADNGTVSINGAASFEENELQRRKMGCIIESPGLYAGLTARQNLEARARLLNVNRSVIDPTLRLVGLEYVRGKKVKNFSLGMKQRLALALALLNEPEILLLDEPVNGLDPIGITNIRELLLKINAELGTTIVVSSHYLGELERLARTFGILEQGRLIREITAQQLSEAVGNYVRIAVVSSLTDTPHAVDVLRGAGIGILRVENDLIFVDCAAERIPDLNRLLVGNDISIRSIDWFREDFESYFLKIMRGEVK